METYRELVGTDESKHDMVIFFEKLHEHETEYRRFKKRREGSTSTTTTAPVLYSKSDKDKSEADGIPTCRKHEADGKCSYGDECIYRHEDSDGNLLKDPVAARKHSQGEGRGCGRGNGSGKGRGRGRGAGKTYIVKQFNNKKKETKKLKKQLKRANGGSTSGEDGGSRKKSKITLTTEELGNKIKEAKESGAVNYREQVMLSKPSLD